MFKSFDEILKSQRQQKQQRQQRQQELDDEINEAWDSLDLLRKIHYGSKNEMYYAYLKETDQYFNEPH